MVAYAIPGHRVYILFNNPGYLLSCIYVGYTNYKYRQAVHCNAGDRRWLPTMKAEFNILAGDMLLGITSSMGRKWSDEYMIREDACGGD